MGIAGRAVLWGGLLLASTCVQGAAGAAEHNYRPAKGYVPDDRTAIQIALAVWMPIYGKTQISSERPFQATLTHGIWTVTGSMPDKMPGKFTVGGTALAQIRRRDGCILRVTHGK